MIYFDFVTVLLKKLLLLAHTKLKKNALQKPQLLGSSVLIK